MNKRLILILTVWSLLVFAAGAWAGGAINANMRGKNADGNWIDLTVNSSGVLKVIGV